MIAGPILINSRFKMASSRNTMTKRCEQDAHGIEGKNPRRTLYRDQMERVKNHANAAYKNEEAHGNYPLIDEI